MNKLKSPDTSAQLIETRWTSNCSWKQKKKKKRPNQPYWTLSLFSNFSILYQRDASVIT